MRKLLLTFAALFATVMATTAAEHIIQFNELPTQAQQTINKHFPDKKISYVMMEKELTKTEYTVHFEDETEIEFKGNGDWEEMKTKNGCLPTGVFSNAVIDFLNQKHAGFCISEAEKDWHILNIELKNGLEITFNSKGEFLRYDD